MQEPLGTSLCCMQMDHTCIWTGVASCCTCLLPQDYCSLTLCVSCSFWDRTLSRVLCCLGTSCIAAQ